MEPDGYTERTQRRADRSWCISLERIAGGTRSTIQRSYYAATEYLAEQMAEKELPGWKIDKAPF